ncbi:uncharacterized protein LOC134575166 [Pelobates fuscus]|uniref:uncharacterized protein LOC134575166 n=1 Tax=Pelobates fuscus TaxID=191477 RepID=UPI002FE4F105
MPKCIVKDCRNGHTKNAEDCSFYSFPSTPDRIKEWLLASGDEFKNIDAVIEYIIQQKKSSVFRICSDHFTPEMFSVTHKRKTLKYDAVPTIFPKASVLCVVHGLESALQDSTTDIEMVDLIYPTNDASIHSGPDIDNALVVYDHDYASGYCYPLPLPKRTYNKETNTSIETNDKCITTSQYYGRRNVSTQTSNRYLKRDAATTAFDLCKKRDIWTWTGVTDQPMGSIDFNSGMCPKTKSSDRYLSKPDEKISEENNSASSRTIIQQPQFDDPISQMSSTHRDTDTESTVSASEFSDHGFSPDEQSTDIGEISYITEPLPEDYLSEKKFVVFESCLDKLLGSVQTCSFSTTCTAPIAHKEKILTGTLLTVYTVCERNHRCEFWKSQPMIGEQSCGNILASASILFSGSHFSKVRDFFTIFGLPFISPSLHYSYQKKYLFPIVDLHYEKERKFILDSLKGKVVCLAGHSQCDSPGGTARYCTYSLLEETTQKIIECITIPVTKATPSVEKAFTQCMDQVLAERLIIAILVTNCHVRIRKIMRENYKKINHQFDIWHYCKKLRTKLATLTRQSTCKELVPWQRTIINNMWLACSSCRGNSALLREKWNSVLHHIINKHEWDSGTSLHRCEHEGLKESKARKRKWLKKNELAYSKLYNFVNDSRLQEDLPHMAYFCHTGSLKLFTNLVLKYRPNGVHYSKDGVVARTKLAVLAHNARVDREQATVQRACDGTYEAGDLHYTPYFSKRRKTWHIKKKYGATTFSHIYPMIADVLRFASGDLQVNWNPR